MIDRTPRVLNRRTDPPTPGCRYVGRPSVYGNPFPVEEHGQFRAVQMYNKWIFLPEQDWLREMMSRNLRGRDLVCWCKPKLCHADTILRIANL